jgi:hypothetical protein
MFASSILAWTKRRSFASVEAAAERTNQNGAIDAGTATIAPCLRNSRLDSRPGGLTTRCCP